MDKHSYDFMYAFVIWGRKSFFWWNTCSWSAQLHFPVSFSVVVFVDHGSTDVLKALHTSTG